MKNIVAILLMLLLITGCGQANTPAPAAEAIAAPTSAPTSAPTAEPSAEPSAEPASTEAAAAEAPACAFAFSAKTLDGEKVTQDFFLQYDLTMVNVWASWCGPCQGELKELGQLYGRLPENVGLLSITVDDPGDLDDAKALLEQNGCAFPCLDAGSSSGLYRNFLGKVQAIPTTIFFDRTGNQVGQWIVGVPQSKGSVSDAYMAQIQSRLDQLSGQ